MTLPTNQPINGSDDDSDMFGPPRSSPPIGYHHHRSKVPMISPKLRQREERKRIIQLCAHKLERIKDSEANLRRSVCINNTYSRLNDEVRREKQNRYLANLPKPDSKPETAHDNIFSPYNNCNGGNNQNELQQNNLITSPTTNHHHHHHHHHHHYLQNDTMEIYPNLSQNYHHHLHHLQPTSSSSSSSCSLTTNQTSSCALINLGKSTNVSTTSSSISTQSIININSSVNNSNLSQNSISSSSLSPSLSSITTTSSCQLYLTSCSSNSNNSILTSTSSSSSSSLSSLSSSISNDFNIQYNNNNNKKEKRSRSLSCLSNNSVDTDLEILDRELSAIDASMPLIDPEITQGAEHLEKAVSSRKRLRSNEDENDRLVREALSQFYLPSTQRLISAIDDCPLDIKRSKLSSSTSTSSSSALSMMNHNNNDIDLDLALDLNSSHKEFEVIMDALRLGTPSPTSSCGSDSCGQAAMMSESGGGVFHNLVVTSLET